MSDCGIRRYTAVSRAGGKKSFATRFLNFTYVHVFRYIVIYLYMIFMSRVFLGFFFLFRGRERHALSKVTIVSSRRTNSVKNNSSTIISNVLLSIRTRVVRGYFYFIRDAGQDRKKKKTIILIIFFSIVIIYKKTKNSWKIPFFFFI